MTYRDNGSYIRFPDSVRTLPEKNLQSASAAMDKLLKDGQEKEHLLDEPAVTETQNAFKSL